MIGRYRSRHRNGHAVHPSSFRCLSLMSAGPVGLSRHQVGPVATSPPTRPLPRVALTCL
ncbi:hypothetical protein MYVA_3513 [Mycolicibacterium vaccae 95051]|nr:hypothetical protein MYVA_3513 [Mycolicibacterium vaccae 95051]